VTGPRRLTVRTAPRASAVVESALVVTLHDGRPGFSARIADVRRLDGATLLLFEEGGSAPAISGTASVLRSGTAYDEVRGRTRAAEPWWRRGARRAENAVVVLDTGAVDGS
jgi:hypothetical protein